MSIPRKPKTRPKPNTVGWRVWRVRRAFGETAEEVGLAIGRTRSALSQWECGKTHPTVPNLRKFARRFGMPLGWLLDGEGPEPDLPTPELLHELALEGWRELVRKRNRRRR